MIVFARTCDQSSILRFSDAAFSEPPHTLPSDLSPSSDLYDAGVKLCDGAWPRFGLGLAFTHVSRDMFTL